MDLYGDRDYVYISLSFPTQNCLTDIYKILS